MAIDTWPMSLTPTIGDSGGLQINKTTARKKGPVEPVTAFKNLVSQVKNSSWVMTCTNTRWYVTFISISACGEGD